MAISIDGTCPARPLGRDAAPLLTWGRDTPEPKRGGDRAMDARRFDDVARLFGVTSTRRTAFRLAAATLFGIHHGASEHLAEARRCRLIGEPCGNKAKQRCCAGASCNKGAVGGGICTCAPNLTNCRGFCVDIASNPNACGANCDVCPDDTDCCNGSCCKAGQRCCGGTCTDLTSDNLNCGGCTQQCPENLTCCASRCRILNTDAHCGACGFACDARRTCVEGRCDCRPGYRDCGDGVCRNLKTDRQNCGMCGRACGGSQTCRGGRCWK